MNALNMRISAYLPTIVRRYLENMDHMKLPETHNCTTVSMFADVSGFTAMTESLAAKGPAGAECLGKYLNSYFEQMLKLISSAGGDVFKFAGDAMIVFWSENTDDTIAVLIRRCIQCALRIQEHLHQAELARGVVLSVKVGIGVGGVTIAHLGGMNDGTVSRIEYIATGSAVVQALQAEHHATAGNVVCTHDAWELVREFITAKKIDDAPYYQVTAVTKAVKSCSRRPSFTRDDQQLHNTLRRYVPRAVWPFLDAHEEFWGSELRDVTVLFINIGFSDEALADMLDTNGIQQLQRAFAAVQGTIYDYEGTINKFLVDDKGSTVVAAFGLPPVAHENDPVRGILASLAICARLGKLGNRASVGITSGTVFCGVVGHQGNRREYTVLGDIVNLSARLMQKAKAENGGVITDASTHEVAQHFLHFEKRPEIMVKGKHDSIQIHRPYIRMSEMIKMQMKSGINKSKNFENQERARPINVMLNMHEFQVETAHRRQSSLHCPSKKGKDDAVIWDEQTEGPALKQIRQNLMQRCIQLSPDRVGGAFILEGEIGLGKTMLLQTTITKPQVRNCFFMIGAGNPFKQGSATKSYEVWAEMIISGLRTSLMDDFTWTRCIADILQVDLPPSTSVPHHSYKLNDLLGTNFPSPSCQENDDQPATWLSDILDIEARRSRGKSVVQDLARDESSNKEKGPEEDSDEGISNVWNDNSDDIWEEFNHTLGVYGLDVPGILILWILRSLAKERQIVCIMDNASFVDQKSWVLASIVSRYLTNVLLVIATRPVPRATSIETNAFRKQLRLIKRLPNTTIAVLEPLAPLRTEELVCRQLGVPTISKELACILVSRSQGNPLFLLEILDEMKKQKVLIIDKNTCITRAQQPWGDKSTAEFCFQCNNKFPASKERHRCKCCGYVFCESCSPEACRKNLPGENEMSRHCISCYSISRTRRPSFERSTISSNNSTSPKRSRIQLRAHSTHSPSPLKNRIALRPPRTVKSVLTTLLDHLSVSQRMIMKTASVIGETFEVGVLRGVYPIQDHLDHLESDLEELEHLSMIRKVEICDGVIASQDSDRIKYEFTHGFMLDVIRHQMLSVQLDKMHHRVCEFKEHQEKELRQKFFNKAHRSISKVIKNDISKIAPHLRLKAGVVHVMKHSGLFSALRKAPLWKKRFAVLQNSRLLLQYDETNGSQPHRCTCLSLQGAKVSILGTESTVRPHCIQIDVVSWNRDKRVIGKARVFTFSVKSQHEAQSWIYMIKYAIESINRIGDEPSLTNQDNRLLEE